LIVAMGEWVLEEACRQKQQWREAGLPAIDMAINLASPSFRKPDLVERVAATLQQYGVPPAELCLEATESILMRDADVTMATLNRLRDLGVKLSVDDFGTGYSSLSYLRRFPINQLKIDRSFVNEVTENPDDAAIIAAIASLAHTLKLEVVAEGVETAEQMSRLAEQGCRMMQGFFFSRPLPAAQMTRLLGDDSEFRERILKVAHSQPPRLHAAAA
jgi:EAL domain-containing protein (putative c-di-GMP-specific phosphodiesterase class I)